MPGAVGQGVWTEATGADLGLGFSQELRSHWRVLSRAVAGSICEARLGRKDCCKGQKESRETSPESPVLVGWSEVMVG